MEDSINLLYSSMNKSSSDTNTRTETAEESGWTAYIEDFLYTQQREYHQNSISDHRQHDNPASDAASHVERKVSNHPMISGGSPKFSKKLNFITKSNGRRRREILYYDDSLEDTASSPVNSPKVGNSDEMMFHQRKVDDIMESSLGNGGGFDMNLQPQTREDRSRQMVCEDKNKESTDLRKRGLCLVPLSMFVNYME